jgi:glycerol uptake facilitator protein
MDAIMKQFLGEFLGTMILILLGNGVVAGVCLKGTKSEGAGWMVVTTAWALAVVAGIYTAGQASGAHLNPAVTISLAVTDANFGWSSVPVYIAGQMLGAIAGACLVFFHYKPHYAMTDDQGTKLATFATAPAVRDTSSNLIGEFIGTFVLMFGLGAIGANKFDAGFNPLAVGIMVSVIGLSLGGTTGYAINPARDLGPRIAHAFLPISGKGSSDWGYAWIPVVAPILGGVCGSLLWKFTLGA